MTRLFELPVGKNHAFLLALQNQGFTLEDAEDAINDPFKAKLIVNALRPESKETGPARFIHLLHSLEQQQILLKVYDKFPDNLRPPLWEIQELDVSSTHVQSVEDLEFFFVALDNLENTWKFNLKLLELTQPDLNFSRLLTDSASLRQDVSNLYLKKGIHRIRINLMDNWSKEGGRSVDQVRTEAGNAGQFLAGIEAIAAYGLQQPELLRSQDGVNLPYCDLAGLEQAGIFNGVPYFLWREGVRDIGFGFWSSSDVHIQYAAPTVKM